MEASGHVGRPVSSSRTAGTEFRGDRGHTMASKDWRSLRTICGIMGRNWGWGERLPEFSQCGAEAEMPCLSFPQRHSPSAAPSARFSLACFGYVNMGFEGFSTSIYLSKK